MCTCGTFTEIRRRRKKYPLIDPGYVITLALGFSLSMTEQLNIRSLNRSIRYFRCELRRISNVEYGDEIFKLHLIDIYRMRIEALRDFKRSLKSNY